ncbi:MAG TPA: polysaccharide deacetylase family protein [Chitinophagaceae bacterium]|nr:polysaccharide deacetylase family protein [Chitinophagaceae bacterium]HQX73831.1 polysaccharide deacetylase family protein [Chitinophagaceae bacterium]HQZ76042.1 polysaccharide deacetylase family protein [Chitinophagaceae bacterium]
MQKYFVKTPWWLKQLYSSRIWSIDTNEKKIYLTFDDGPHPTITPFVLGELKKYGAKATFFCIGKNVVSYPGVYQQILDEGHRTGNHTQNHLNGWQTVNDIYFSDIEEATLYINSDLFRPPYGRIRSSQAKYIRRAMDKETAKIVMWDVLSGDFDKSTTPEQCLKNVVEKTNDGSVIVFHDSVKAWEKLSYTLPRILEHFSRKGFTFSAIS